jgi:HEAT repeat protein
MMLALFLSMVTIANESGPKETDVSGLIEVIRRALPITDPESPIVRRGNTAMDQLRELGPKGARAVPILIEAMKNKTTGLRRNAGYTLGHMGAAAVPALMEALRDDDREVRIDAAYALGHIGPDAAKAVPAILPLLRDQDPRVRENILRTLWKVGFVNDEVVSKVASLLADKERNVAEQAASALKTFARVRPKLTAKAVPQLIEALKRDDGPAGVVSALGAIGEPAVPALIETLQHPDANARCAAANTLGWIGKRAAKAEPGLLRLLRDKEPESRRIAIEALGRIADVSDQAVAGIAGVLDDKDERVRMAAIDTMGQLGPRAKAYGAALLRLVQGDAEKDIWVRVHAALALVQIGPVPREAVTFLAGCLKHQDGLIRPWAAGGLLALGPAARPALPGMLAALKAPPPPPPKDTAEYHYINNLAHRRTRLTILETIVQFGPDAASALPELERLAREGKDKEVCDAAKEAARIIRQSAEQP